MRIGFLIVISAVLLVGCTGTTDVADAPITPDGDATTITAAGSVDAETLRLPPQLADHDHDLVVVGERLMLLAIADSPGLRAQGLMEVTDLGDLDGMLFYWRHEASGGFWMQNTVIPLDVVWFNEDGTYADRASMEPCPPDLGDDCPIYTPDGEPDYRYAIEAPPDTLDWIDPTTVIEYSD